MFIPTAEPFFMPGGSVGVLLVHGFTGTPKEMRSMGEYLANQGYSILAVRLAGHATHPEDLVRVRWQDWLASIEDGYHLLKGIAQDIVVAGLSLGGALSLIFAARFPVAGLIAMSTIYELPPDPRKPFLRLLWRVIPTIPKGESDWVDPILAGDHVDYPHYTTRAIIEVNEVIAEMQSSLPDVHAPALLMHSKKDGSVPYEHMEKIYSRLGSQDKQMFTIERSGHVIIRDIQKDQVFAAADQFIRRITTTHS